MQSSWQERRAFLDSAIETLGSTQLGARAKRAMDKLHPVPQRFEEFVHLTDIGSAVKAGSFNLRFSPETGALVSLRDEAGRDWASESAPLGLVTYESFSSTFFDRYYDYYNQHKEKTESWARPDFGKPGLEKTGAIDQLVPARLDGLWRLPTRSDVTRLALALSFPDVKQPSYGQPARVELLYTIRHDAASVEIELQWFNKPASRLPEALWFSFRPVFESAPRCTVDKLGQKVDVTDVVSDGNRYLHAVGDGGARLRDRTGTFRLQSLDAPLIAIGRRQLVKSDDAQPDTGGGLHVNLLNNLWGTNFRMWYDEDARFRFKVDMA